MRVPSLPMVFKERGSSAEIPQQLRSWLATSTPYESVSEWFSALRVHIPAHRHRIGLFARHSCSFHSCLNQNTDGCRPRPDSYSCSASDYVLLVHCNACIRSARSVAPLDEACLYSSSSSRGDRVMPRSAPSFPLSTVLCPSGPAWLPEHSY